MRTGMGALGVGLIGYGGWLLVTAQDMSGVGWVVVWAAVGVALHDVVLAPMVLLLGWAGRRLPRPVLAGGVGVLVLLGAVTLVAVPVLGRFGASPTNPTLLGRDYGRGWLLVAAIAVAAGTAVGVAGLRSAAGGGRSAGGPGSRRR